MLPTKVKIGPVDYAIEVVDNLHYHDSEDRRQLLHGQVLFNAAEIKIDSDQSDRIKCMVIWHEALHALLYQAGIDGVTEETVRMLGYALPGFIQDNPELMLMTLGKTGASENE